MERITHINAENDSINCSSTVVIAFISVKDLRIIQSIVSTETSDT